ncbi:MAG: hypothetical protein JKX69_01755 [Rhodobacteraceae bacterium]|nr:hypothetical protein [Paracoccaceae bacterium]
MRILPILLAFAPLAAHAEGAQTTLNCVSVQVCDGTECEAKADELVIRYQPVETDDLGRGAYLIELGEHNAVEGTGFSFLGPFYWETSYIQLTLMFSSETTMLLHLFDPTSGEPATYATLTCEVVQ